MSKFIPKPYKKDPITIRMEPDKYSKIDLLAAKYDLT